MANRPYQEHHGKARNLGKYGRPTYNQAAKIVAKFGGEAACARACGLSRMTIYRWQYRRPYGSDGMVPSRQVDTVMKAARMWGVCLVDSDWWPERIKYEANPTAKPSESNDGLDRRAENKG